TISALPRSPSYPFLPPVQIVRRRPGSGARRLEHIPRERLEPCFDARRSGIAAGHGRREETFGDVHAELPIGFELLLVKELIKRALMGKRRVKHAVTFDELRLVTCYRELQVQEQSGLVRAVLSGIVNSTKHRMALAQIRRRIGAQVVQA